MLYINSDTELRKYLPNAFSTLPGDPTFFDKIRPHLEVAERTVANKILGEELTAVFAEKGDMQTLVAQLVATQALITAIPAIDLVLTDNGFGIVSTETIAPASRDRVERLLASLRESLDNTVTDIIEEIMKSEELRERWMRSPAGQYWTGTLFHTPASVRPLDRRDGKESLLELHETLLPAITVAESRIAREWLSPQLMDVLRRVRRPEGTVTEARIGLVASMARRAVAMSANAGLDMAREHLRGIIEIVAAAPEEFPEWHRSTTAQLFSPDEDMKFTNRNGSGGYWF